MTSYTMLFKDAIEHAGGEIVEASGFTILNNATAIGLGSYPIFSPEYRVRLNGLIVDRYMNHEIGFESISEFRLAIRRRLNEIMPFYNRMYEADVLKFDPLRGVDLTTISDSEAEGNATISNAGTSRSDDSTVTDGESSTTATTTSESDNRARSVTSDTPQTLLNGSEDYASGANDQTSKSTGTGGSSDNAKSLQNVSGTSLNESNTNTDSLTKDKAHGKTRMFGYQGSPSEMIISYRASLSNTDSMLLDELRDCFMQTFNVDTNYPYARPRVYRRF